VRAHLMDIAYGPGSSYSLTISLENLDADRAVFAMSPAVRAYVQVGFSWQEVPSKPSDGRELSAGAIASSGRNLREMASPAKNRCALRSDRRMALDVRFVIP
jgi:hypothetical protein